MPKNYSSTLERYAIILNELNASEKVHISRLVDLTGSSVRNLQMDLNKRLKEPFRIETDNIGSYWIDKKYQGLYTSQELKQFSSISGISERFPEFDSNFLRQVIDLKHNDSFMIKSKRNNTTIDEDIFKAVIRAIENRQNIFFRYKNKSPNVSPYKLIYIYGYWYLCAVNNGILKTYNLYKIQNVRTNNNKFKYDESIMDLIENTDTIWMSNTKETKTIILKVEQQDVRYFMDNIIIPGETQRNEEDDGSLTVTVKSKFFDEILYIVISCIPIIKILEPEELKVKLKKRLTDYINNI